MATFDLKGHRVSIHPNNGQLFVDGKDTGLKQWRSDAKRWSDLNGSEQKNLRGKSLEEMLVIKGYIPARSRGFSRDTHSVVSHHQSVIRALARPPNTGGLFYGKTIKKTKPLLAERLMKGLPLRDILRNKSYFRKSNTGIVLP